nr:hypothetical protein [Tanacetum cinerariifolium]
MMLPINSPVSYVKIAFNPTKSPHYKVIHIKFVDYVDDYGFRFGYCQIETYTRNWSPGGDRNRYGGSSLTTFLTATSFPTMIPDEDLIFGDDNMGLVVVGFGVDEVTVVDELVGGGGRRCGGGDEDMRMR